MNMHLATPRVAQSIVLSLSLIMLATRFGHLGSAWSLPDASWAIFFVGGFYLARQWRWLLPWLMLEAVTIDLIAINHFGVSNYCVTVAYAFNALGYAVLWLGGCWLQRQLQQRAADVLRLTLSALVAEGLCYLITNASFYWLGGRVRQPTSAGWVSNFSDWYLAYLGNTAMYVAIAALLHWVLVRRTNATAQTFGLRNR